LTANQALGTLEESILVHNRVSQPIFRIRFFAKVRSGLGRNFPLRPNFLEQSD
jgi:hypothetical protein